MSSKREILLISACIIIPVAILAIGLTGLFVASGNYHESLLETGAYLQNCSDTNSPATLSGLESAIQGATTRTETTRQDGTRLVVYTWQVLGAVDTAKRLHVHVGGDTEVEPVVLALSRDPI